MRPTSFFRLLSPSFLHLLILLCLYLYLPFSLHAQVLVSAKLDGKWGLLDSSGRWHIQPTYDSLGPFFQRSVPFYNNGKWGLLHASGKVISPAIWEDVSNESEGMVAVYDGSFWGFINMEGKTVITPQFLEADDFYEGLAGASKLEENWGFIDSTGKWAIAPQYTFVTDFSEGPAFVKEDSKGYLIDRHGQKVDDSLLPPANQRVVSVDRKVGIERQDGTWLIPMVYDNLSLRSEAVYFFLDKGKWGMTDTFQRILYAPKLEQYRSFFEGLAAVKMDGKWGYVNRSGDVVIPFIFDEAQGFSYGRAAVSFGGKWGVISKGGDFLVSPRYQQINGQYQPVHPTLYTQPEISTD